MFWLAILHLACLWIVADIVEHAPVLPWHD